MEDFNHLISLPGTFQEQTWLKERLETMSVRESYVLSAAVMRHPPENMSEAIDSLRSLDNFDVCFPAGNYEQLGQFHLKQNAKLPDSVLPYVDMEQMGRLYEDIRPGLFIGNCYVVYPEPSSALNRKENAPLPLLDMDWSVKLKLASPAVLEGVWLCLPDHDGNMAEYSSEVVLALDMLKVNSLEECTLLEARCILPEAGDLMKQYNNVTELVRDGGNLGFVLDEQGQGESHWMEKFTAALEYENCRTLRFALDISQNLHCYEWVSSEGLADFASNMLRKADVPDALIQSGCIDLEAYAADFLETSGYMQASGETGYLLRNGREFIREFTASELADSNQAAGPIMGHGP